MPSGGLENVPKAKKKKTFIAPFHGYVFNYLEVAEPPQGDVYF